MTSVNGAELFISIVRIGDIHNSPQGLWLNPALQRKQSLFKLFICKDELLISIIRINDIN